MSNKLRQEIDQRRKRDYCSTLAQRRYVTGLLRDGYDMATADADIQDKPFSVTLHTSELPHDLTARNRNYFSHEHSYHELNTLFGHIAIDATVEIEPEDDDFVITLLREHPEQMPAQD
jgi:hypothetical protein